MGGRKHGDDADVPLSTDESRANQHQHALKNSPFSRLDVELKLAWDPVKLQSVALKTFRTDSGAVRDHPCSQLVEYEIKSMDRVASHHNIVHLIEVVVSPPSIVRLVMEAAAASRGSLVEMIAAAPERR